MIKKLGGRVMQEKSVCCHLCRKFQLNLRRKARTRSMDDSKSNKLQIRELRVG